MNHDYKLYTFSLSHFSEKIRWMLDYSRIPYREIRWTPFFHILPALLKSRHATTVPILQTESSAIQDSTLIMLWLEQNEALFKLIPADPEQRKEVLEIEKSFNRVGAHVIRYTYSAVLENPALLKQVWTLDANRFQRAAIVVGFPALRAALRRVYKITPDNASRSGKKLEEAIQWLDDRLTNKHFLVGERLSAADITAAALLAPLVCPAEHPIYGRADYRDALRPLREPWEQRRAFAWVCSLYREQRRSGVPRQSP